MMIGNADTRPMVSAGWMFSVSALISNQPKTPAPNTLQNDAIGLFATHSNTLMI